MRHWITSLSRQPKEWVISLSILCVALIGLIDYYTGTEVQVSVFYLLPIVFATWLTDRYCGYFMCIFSGVIFFWADYLGGHQSVLPAVRYWNAIVMVDFFFIVTVLLVEMKSLMDQEKENARTDFLTGTANRRHFNEMVQKEIERARRYNHIFSVVCVDLDHFKKVNDVMGHAVGDRVLRCVTDTMRNEIRKTDVAARIGGDEFALLLSETGFREAEMTVQKLRASLIQAMERNGWPINFSIGVATFTHPGETLDEVMNRADMMMYLAKEANRKREPKPSDAEDTY